MDKLLAKLSEQQAALSQQHEAFKSVEDDPYSSKNHDQGSSSNSLPVTPATDGFPTTAPTTRPASANVDERPEGEEVLRLKLQLAQAQNHISKLDQELAHNRKPEPENLGLGPRGWQAPEDGQSDTSDTVSTTTFNRTRGIWGNPKASFANAPIQAPIAEPSPAHWLGGRAGPSFLDSQTTFSVVDAPRPERLTPDSDLLMRAQGGRRGNRFDSRMNSPQQFNNPCGGFNPPNPQYDSMLNGPLARAPMPPGPMSGPQGLSPMNMGMFPPQGQQAVGTQLSPYASEFTSKSAWGNEVCTQQTRI
jgi:hypothetical protein